MDRIYASKIHIQSDAFKYKFVSTLYVTILLIKPSLTIKKNV